MSKLLFFLTSMCISTAIFSQIHYVNSTHLIALNASCSKLCSDTAVCDYKASFQCMVEGTCILRLGGDILEVALNVCNGVEDSELELNCLKGIQNVVSRDIEHQMKNCIHGHDRDPAAAVSCIYAVLEDHTDIGESASSRACYQ